jgi:hypothetical protein
VLNTETAKPDPNYLVNVDGDGDCFYRAMAIARHGTDANDEHKVVRRELMAQLEKDLENGEQWMSGNFIIFYHLLFFIFYYESVYYLLLHLLCLKMLKYLHRFLIFECILIWPFF